MNEIKYAIPCDFGKPEDGRFFTFFNTNNEGEALKLASCIVGADARKLLVIIDDNGKVVNI